MPVDNALYDRLAGSWWDEAGFLHALAALNPARFGYMRRVLTEELHLTPKDLHVLDVGCGGGLLAEEFARLGCAVTGVDPSRESVAAARAHAATQGLVIEYRTGRGEALPFPAESFDVVYCCDVLEHVADLRQVIAETARVLRPGGIYLCDTINRTLRSWLVVIKLLQDWRWTALMPPRLHDWRMFIRPGELTRLLEQHGLRPIRLTGLKPRANPLRLIQVLRRRRRGLLSYAEAVEQMDLGESSDVSVSYIGCWRKLGPTRSQSVAREPGFWRSAWRRMFRRMVSAGPAATVLWACRPAAGPVPRPGPTWTDPSPHRVEFIGVAPGVRLEVLDWGGSGPPLVFLAGLQDVAHGFDDFAPRFTDRHHVLAITRRGYGASSQPRWGYDLATRVADLRAVLDSLRLPRVTLVGHSMAGDELTALAGAYPARVIQLVYLDAAYDHSGLTVLLGKGPPPPPMLASDSASPSAVQRYLRRVYGMRIPEAQLRAIGRYDTAGRLVADVTPAAIDSLMLVGCGHPDYAAVRAPALVIDAVIDSAPQVFPDWAALDPGRRAAARSFTAALQAWAATERARVRRELRGARLLALHGANHYVFSSHPAEVTQAMRAFLTSDH